MDAINIFSVESIEGRVDVARTVGSRATSMFIYDLAPGQRQSPYHYEYEEGWCSSSTARSCCVRPMGSTPWSEDTSSASRLVLQVRISS
jgi:hypothetical protein